MSQNVVEEEPEPTDYMGKWEKLIHLTRYTFHRNVTNNMLEQTKPTAKPTIPTPPTHHNATTGTTTAFVNADSPIRNRPSITTTTTAVTP